MRVLFSFDNDSVGALPQLLEAKHVALDSATFFEFVGDQWMTSESPSDRALVVYDAVKMQMSLPQDEKLIVAGIVIESELLMNSVILRCIYTWALDHHIIVRVHETPKRSAA